MAYEQITIREIVERAVNHSWSIPEFQRGFVWKATQVRDLAESLWLDYPIGALLVWNSRGPTEEQHAHDAQRPGLWVVDGQQRSSALCILCGRKPYWWPSVDEWNKTLRKFDIRFDVNAKEPPFFWVANAVIRKATGSRYIPLRELLVLDTSREKDQKTLQASRFGRYSGSGTTSLEEDLRDVHDASSLSDAVHRLLRRFAHSDPLTADDFLRDYGDSRFGRFLLYLLIYRNRAQDWDEHGHRIGFEGLSLLADFRPQWHHIFPKKYLDGKIDDSLIDALGNIAVIGPEINIRISAKDPMSYIDKYKITHQKLAQQFVDPATLSLSHEGYEAWVRNRAKRLADVGNEFLAELAPSEPAG